MSGETTAGRERDWVETLRRAVAVLGGVWLGLWGATIVHWVTGLAGGALLPVVVAFAVAGAALGWRSARSLPAWTTRDRRDAIVGWSFVLALTALIALAALLGVGE